MTNERTVALSATLALLAAGPLAAQDSPELETPVRISAGGDWIDTGKDIGYAGPQFVDHDGDGLPDLLVSSFRGNIRFFKNVGTRNEPTFEEKGPLQAAGEAIRIHNW